MNTQAFWVLLATAIVGISDAGEVYDWDFCTTSNPCSLGQGDCDKNSECHGFLVCGKDNCQRFAPNVASGKDCCRDAELYDWVYCENNLCNYGEGDCDSDDECSGNLVCGTDNCKTMHPYLATDPNKDCCRMDSEADDYDGPKPPTK